MAPTNQDRLALLKLQFQLYKYKASRKRRPRSCWVKKRHTSAAKELGEYKTFFLGEVRNDPELFKDYCRMSPACFDHLLGLIRHDIEKKNTNFRDAICPEQRLVITLRFLSRGTAQESLAHQFRIASSTVCNIVKETCIAIFKNLRHIYMSFPTCPEQWKAISDEFNEIHNLPHCVGAIDGKHIKIDCPAKTGSAYHNYHGYFSMILLGVCDAKYRFTYIDFGQYGATNDSAALNNSDLYLKLEAHEVNFPAADEIDENYRVNGVCPVMPYYFVGDEIFALRRYLMRPYPGRKRAVLPVDEQIFNYRQCRARRPIEQTFGIMAARWRILRTSIKALEENIGHYVFAACTLHNYLMQTDETVYCPPGFTDSETSTGFKEGEWRTIAGEQDGLMPMDRPRGHIYHRKGYLMQDDLKDYLNSDVGAIPWQWNHILDSGMEE